MHKRYLLALYRIGFAGLVGAAICVQLWRSVTQHLSIVNFFSFFTIESNIIAAIVFLVGSVAAVRSARSGRLAMWRGAATLYMTVTGIVYALLLRNVNVQTTIPWVNIVLHYIFPIVVLLDWFVALPGMRLRFRRALIWLAFPLAYLAYSLVRGLIVHWYPYPFLDPAKRGYAGVALTSGILLLAGVGIVGIVTWASRFGAPAKAK